MTLLTLLLPSICLADVTVSNDGDIYTLQNAHARIEVDASAGARIRSWVLIPSERDLIAVWNGANEIGGALDDRAFFTAMRYRPAIMHPGPDSGELRLEASHPSGLAVAKRLILHRDSPALSVLYEWRNGTQSPRRLFVRNFFLPGHKPQDDQHLYWVNATPDAVEGSPEASNYYVPADPPYSAMWDSETGDGIAALVPGVDKFYFWRGSKEFPTFEWLHEDVQAGKVLHASVLLRAVEGDEEAPDWPALLADPPPEIKTARLTDLAGWKDEAALFAVTDDEREKGFWLSVGEGDGKQRLPESIEIDVPAGEHRYIGVTINALEDFAAPVEFRAPKGVAAYWQTLGEDRRELLLLPEEPVQFTDGGRETLWLRVGGAKGATYDATLMIGDVATNIPIRLRAWEVDLTQARPFHLRGYCGGFTTWTGGYTVDEAKLPRLNGILTAFAEMGGDVLDWNTHWAGFMPGVKLAETGEWLAEVAKANPERIDLNDLPDLDFTHFDPWLEAFKDHGVTRVDTHMMHPGNASLSWRLFGPAIGADRVEAGTPEAERVLVWWFTQMRLYLESHNLTGFFCKISDEISPEHIPAHLETAKLARQAGWRPFTTITGMIARTASHIETMDPACDQWQLAFSLKDEFLALRDKRFSLVDETYELPANWGGYSNGGAVDTWGMAVFGEGQPVPVEPGLIEGFELLEDGEPLGKEGGSPWGNKDRGVVITGGKLHKHLYLSPTAGVPTDHTYTLMLKARRESAEGAPLIQLDDTDEVWCYGGRSRPFRAPYYSGYEYPIMTLHHGFAGYGQWAFYHWNKTERIIWIDEETAEVTISPVYCGYRDGYRDAVLYNQLIETRGREAFDAIVGPADAPLRIGPRTYEVYGFTTLLNADDPVAVNAARRGALEALAR